MHRYSARTGVSGTLRQLFAPLILTDEDSKIRTTRSLRAVLIANMLFALPLAVLVFLTSQRNYAGGLIAFMITLFASLTPLFILRRGKIKLAAGVFLTSLWLMTSVALLVSTGNNTMLGSLYVAVIMMTLLFFGLRATLISISTTLLYTLLISLADLSGIPKLFVITPVASWILLALCLMLVLIPLASMYSTLLRALASAQEQLTAREKAEQALRENAERLQLISSVTSDYMFTTQLSEDGQWAEQILSGAFETITGYSPEAFKALGGWRTIIHPDDLEANKIYTGRLFQNQRSSVELRIVRKDGQTRWVRVSAHPIWDADTQTLRGVNGGVQDITARKEAEIALQENEKRYRMTTELISDYAYAFDIHEDGTLTCSWVTEQPFKRLSGYDWDDPRAQYMLYHPDDARRARQDSERTAKGEPTDGEYRIITSTGDIRWLHIQRQVEWDADHKKPIRFYGAAEDITERKQAEKAIRENETFLRAVIDHLPDTIYAKDLNGRYLINNIESLRRLGAASQEAAVGKRDEDFFQPELAAQWWAACEQIIALGKPVLNQEVFFDLFEGMSWLLTSFIPLRDADGKVMGLVVINRDITERKQAEQALQESERRYRLTSELISDYAYAYNIEADGTRMLSWITEQSFQRLTGYSAEDMRSRVEIYHPDDRDRVLDEVARTVRGEPTDSEYRVITASGEVKWLSVVRQLEWDADHTRAIRYYGSATDITDRKQAELALLASEKRYRMTAELISDYAFAYDILPDGSIELAWGTEQSYQRVTGYDWKVFPTQPALYHPDDRERLVRDRQSALDGKPADGEYRIITASGEVTWVFVKRDVEWDADRTRPLRFYGAVTDITERKFAELALLDSEARMRALLDATNDVAFLMSADFRILTANKPMSRAVGKPLEAIIGSAGASLIQSEIYTSRHQYFEEVLATKQPVRWIDNRNTEQWDNTIYPVLSTTGEVESFAVFGRDISEEARLAAELQRYATQLEHMVEERTTELRRAKEQIEIILNNTRDAIALAQPNGDIQTRNPAFVAMFGEQVSRWIEGLLWTVSGEEHSDSVGQALVNMLHSREGQRIETQIATEDKGDKDIDLMFIPVSLEEEAEQPGILVSAHDITPYKEVQRFKERFVANAVHDLATPIAGLSTRLYLLKRSPEKLDVHMKALENQVEHFRDLLNDLRTLSQLDRKQVTLELQMTPVQQNILRVFDTYEPVALSKNQTLDLTLDPDLPEMLLDRRQIERVFLNLVSNAINYSPDGKSIRIRALREADALVFSVTDEGIGISAEELPHVFERFYRSDRARQTRSSGTGLGLSIVKEIVELHGGSVAAQSEAGTGSTFTVRLPINTA